MKKHFALGLCILLALCSGCAGSETEEDPVVLVSKEEQKEEYSLAVAGINDIVLTKKIKCVYEEVNQQNAAFLMSGSTISKVYVREGDLVEKGQLLAQLSGGNKEREIKELEYQIARSEVLLEHAKVNEEYEISNHKINFEYNSSQSEEDRNAMNREIKAVQKRYQYIKEDCQDSMTINQQKLNLLKEEYNKSLLYAQMSGMVSYLKQDLEGSTSVKEETILTIVDTSQCQFVVDQAEYAPYFSQDTSVEMDITTGNGAGRYELIPSRMKEWGEKLYFELKDGQGQPLMEVGTTGSIAIVLEERREVLTIPLAALHKADGKSYVYMVGAENIKEVKWIETGLEGDALVEVLSGLEKGEKVILK